MSAISYSHAYMVVEDFADAAVGIDTDPKRAAFERLLWLVSVAMRDIEWVDSGGRSPGEEHAAIDAVFAFIEKKREGI